MSSSASSFVSKMTCFWSVFIFAFKSMKLFYYVFTKIAAFWLCSCNLCWDIIRSRSSWSRLASCTLLSSISESEVNSPMSSASQLALFLLKSGKCTSCCLLLLLLISWISDARLPIVPSPMNSYSFLAALKSYLEPSYWVPMYSATVTSESISLICDGRLFPASYWPPNYFEFGTVSRVLLVGLYYC